MADRATRLLHDLPHDVLAHSIDEAIKTSKHGFLPSVGEIRAIAQPIVAEREIQIERLIKMEAALADPEASATRNQRWQDMAARDFAERLPSVRRTATIKPSA
jgi:hypothetical protein